MGLRDLLRSKIEADGGFAVAAEKLDCTREHLYSLCGDSGAGVSLEFAARIEVAYGIAITEWAIEAAA